MAEAQIPKVIAITGSSGYIGEQLVRRLLASDGVERVIGIDRRPSALVHDRFTTFQQEITEPLDALFKDNAVQTVVHLAFVLRQLRDKKESARINVAGASNVLLACEAAGVSRIVLLSSSTVYGAHADNAEEMDERAPVNPPVGFNYAMEKSTVEAHFMRYGARREGLDLSILRSCVVMGPNANNFITEALNKPLLVGLGRADPPMQFLHEDDLIEVLWRFISESHPGIYNVAGPATVRWSELVKMSGKRLARFSPKVASFLTNVTWLLRLQNDAPAAGLDFVRWPWTVSTAKLRAELGYAFKYTSRQALESRLEATGAPQASSAVKATAPKANALTAGASAPETAPEAISDVSASPGEPPLPRPPTIT